MALTVDLLKANADLAALTEAQLNAIVALSKNDENTVIGQKVGEIHGSYEADALAVTGIQKNNGEKAYDYVKRVLGGYKEQLGTLETTKANLEQQLRDKNTDPVLKQKLADTEKALTDLRALYDTDKSTFQTEKQSYEQKLKDQQVAFVFESSTAGLKFKESIPESVHGILVNNAKTELLAKYKPDFVETNGQQVLVFRDAQGNIVSNPANKLNPFTAKELLETTLKDALDFGKQQPGSGTNPPKPGQQTPVVELANAKTQVEADEAIASSLLAQGFTRGSAEFANKQAALRIENGVDKLPIK